MLAHRSPAPQPSRGSREELLLPADPDLQEEEGENQEEKYMQLQGTTLQERTREQGGLLENIRHSAFSNRCGFKHPVRVLSRESVLPWLCQPVQHPAHRPLLSLDQTQQKGSNVFDSHQGFAGLQEGTFAGLLL